jgi:hypothetical protein
MTMLRTLLGSLWALFASLSPGADLDDPPLAGSDLGHTIDPDG